jgi:hypothetical protein
LVRRVHEATSAVGGLEATALRALLHTDLKHGIVFEVKKEIPVK